MAISTDYRVPVQVNGYTCRNCSDVDNAKKHIDPQHPKSGPYDVDAATDPTRAHPATADGPSSDPASKPVGPLARPAAGVGGLVDLRV